MKHMIKLLIAIIILSCSCFLTKGTMVTTFAAETEETVVGRVYEFGEKSDYEYSSAETFKPTSKTITYGDFALSGTIVSEGQNGDMVTYGVDGGKIDFIYSYSDALLNADTDQWHLVEDDGKKVDELKLDTKIKSGAIILQSSKDGKRWITDKTITNVFSDIPVQSEQFYTTNDIQLTNGTFFRVVVAYKMGIKTGEKKIGPIKQEEFDYRKITEVFEFYLYDVSSNDKSSDVILKKNLGEVVNTGKDNGYSGSNPLTIKDPHYGWTLGQFFVSGYTRETMDSDTKKPVFLKNVGDEVTLWFNLKQDIDQLNGDSTLSINDDANGYDQYFQVEKTGMGRGTLIIQYTDYQGIRQEPDIYTNYLEANATTSADTIVKFFEEGDYEVALDYEIKSTPRQVAGVEIAPEYSNYRIYFTFAIRNGNCMVYPFDAETNSELSDEAITENGFRLDMARSRYLTIDVQRAVVTEGANGYVEDVRFNRPAKDGDQYIDEGIYTFNVKNLYTGENTTKTIYVGNTGYMRALSVNKLTVTELNDQVNQGVTIESDGSLTIPEPETEEQTITEKEINPEGNKEVSGQTVSAEEAHSHSLVPVIIGGVAVVICGATILKNKKKDEEGGRSE